MLLSFVVIIYQRSVYNAILKVFKPVIYDL
jgi:hypothetical protein